LADMELKDIVLSELDRIVDRFVLNTNTWGP
jgi:hypothetical protein